jgi:hypothetical protein
LYFKLFSHERHSPAYGMDIDKRKSEKYNGSCIYL